ncbi:hypothetical protein [Aliikangiella maris]|uniref:Uncharacterized protein n=2 Tax=Aliikangiella maris TaxID=3162458 RepID=A0ABV2BU86_9GAMM
MLTTVVRKEHKNDWERRTALSPSDAADLVEKGFPISVESSGIRVFPDADYQSLNVPIVDSPLASEFVVGIKEPPVNSIQPNQVHLAFSHTFKGQAYNMGLLQKFIDQKATLIDYEPITDSQGKRLIAFGRFAGIAGAIDSLHIAGQKFQVREQKSALSQIKQTCQYHSIDEIKQHFQQIDLNSGEPVRVLIVGSGNVGQGSEEVCQWLGLPKIDIQRLHNQQTPEGSWYAVAKSGDLHQHKNGKAFSMSEFIEAGATTYESTFDRLLGQFDILLQTPYWTEKYPKHLTIERMREHLDKLPLVIADISCDINGSLECTTQLSDVGSPAYTFDVVSATSSEGVQAEGITVIAIDNLPCELSYDASIHFSKILKNYLHNLMSVDLSQPFESCGFSPEIMKAVIVYRGELTPNFTYLQKFLDKHATSQK